MSKASFLVKYGSKEHIDKSIDHPDEQTRETLANYAELKDRHFDRLINDESSSVRRALLKNLK